MTPSPNQVNPVRVAVSPAPGAGGGASLTAPAKSSVDELAFNVVYKTPSEFDSILIVTRSGGIQYASKGQYGGWIAKGKLSSSEDAIALWSFEQKWMEVGDARALDNDVVKRFVEELANHGFDFDHVSNVPKARIVHYKYKPVNITIKKAADRYTVIDMAPAPGDAVIEAETVHIYWPYHISRRGHCSGFCSETMREKAVLVAKMLGLEAYRADIGGRDFEIRVKIVTDYSQVAGFLRSRLAPEPAVATPAVAEAGLPPLPELPGEAAEVEAGGGVAATAAPATPPGYVKARIVSFDLPTEYLGGRTRTSLEEDGEEKKVVMVERKEVRIPQLRTLRKKFYRVLNRMAFKASGMWILMHDVKPEELEELDSVMKEISETLAKHGIHATRNVEIVDAYLPENWIKVKLAEHIEHVTSEIEAKKVVEKKTRDVMREIQRLEELLKRLLKEQKLYGSGSVALQEGAEVA